MFYVAICDFIYSILTYNFCPGELKLYLQICVVLIHVKPCCLLPEVAVYDYPAQNVCNSEAFVILNYLSKSACKVIFNVQKYIKLNSLVKVLEYPWYCFCHSLCKVYYGSLLGRPYWNIGGIIIMVHVYLLGSSGISPKLGTFIVRYSQQKALIPFVYYCFENASFVQIFRTTGPILVGVSANCISLNEHLNQIENWKCHMFNFRLISLDHIT